MKAAIQNKARELGFDLCRVTSAAPPATAPQLERWLAEGRHGEMGWIARNAAKRVDPQLVLPGARSIVCLAASYARAEAERGERILPKEISRFEPLNHSERLLSRPPGTLSSIQNGGEGRGEEVLRFMGRTKNSGVVARYARFADYHDVLGEKLCELTECLNSLGGSGVRSLWYVDTGPILERDLAQRAGVGFIGKHTNLISRSLGNWFFLAEILTTLELEPDAPEKNRCGSCVRCIEACPTRAITAPFELDARRCISYLTIELKGAIPRELRRAIGNRIYGCDDCLAACPWNRFAREATLMRPHARAEFDAPSLIALLALDDAGFKKLFAGTPMLRTKRRGLLRNVCVALGNIGDAEALPALERARNDAEPLIAEHAAWAIEEIVRREKCAR